MSDSIIVRVTLDSYDMASTGRQTQVYVQIPEVARVSWLLPSDLFHRLKDRAWPEVLDVTHDYVTYGGAASNSSSTSAWQAIRQWLTEDANRDEVQAAFEEHEARRHPVARKLLKDNEQLRARLAEHEVSPLAWARLLDAKSLDNFMCALGMAADTDPADGALSQVEEMIRSFRAALPAGAEQERARTLHEHVIARDAEIEKLRARVAELEAAPATVYRASHDSIVMGHYTTRQAARLHCETVLRREVVNYVCLGWIPDDGSDSSPEELSIFGPGVDEDGAPYDTATGYVVTPLEVASRFDEEADE